MAVAFNGTATQAFDEDGNSTQTLNYNIPAGTDMVVVLVGAVRGGTPSVSSVTVGGNAATVAQAIVTASAGFGDTIGVAGYYLAAPPTGSQNIVVTWSGALDYCGVIDAIALTGAAQSSPISGTPVSSTSTSSATKSLSHTTADPDTIRIGARLRFQTSGDTAFSPGTGVTETGDSSTNDAFSFWTGYHIDASAGSFSFSSTASTHSSPEADVGIVFAIKSGATGNPWYYYAQLQ